MELSNRRTLLPILTFVLACALATHADGQHVRAPARSAAVVDAGQLMRDVRVLSAPDMQGRAIGTEGNRRARAFIVRRFREAGLSTIGDGFEHPFSFSRRDGAAREGTNVVGFLKGSSEPDRITVVSAHYDHLGVRDGTLYPGADDNASGVAGLLAAARWFTTHRPQASLLFVAFDGEEQGLQGARQFVARPPVDPKRIALVVNMDMIARGDANTLYVAGTFHYPQLKNTVERVAEGRPIKVAFGHDQRVAGAPASDDWTQASDHGPFHTAGIPFLYFGVEDHADYHKPTDLADRIPAAFFREAVELVIDTVAAFSGAGGMPSAPRSGALAPDERSMVAYIDAHDAEALALLERVVNINSGSMNLEGVRRVGDIFRGELDALGFTTRWEDGAAFKRAGHLVAERRGQGPRILLIGHLDTVFEPDSPFQKFERVDARTARGPGVIDMKGGDVVMIQALKALASVGALKTMNVSIVLTGDEELTGEPVSAARAALVAAAKGADIAIGFEDGPGDPKTAVIARRGTTGWQLRVKAKPAHSSQIFREDIGSGAIYEAARILTAFREKLAGEKHLTFNPGVMLGGTAVEFDAAQSRGTAFGKENVIAERAVVSGDLRTLSKEQLEKAKQAMRQIVAASLPHAEATIAFDEGYPPLAPTEGNRRLLALYDQASRDVGAGPVGPVDPDRAGAADVSFVAGEVGMVLDGVGLMGHSDHTPQETADLTTLSSQTKRAAVLLYRLSRGAR